MSTSADLMIAAPSYAGWDILRRRASDPRSLAEETVLTAGGGPHAQGCLAGGGSQGPSIQILPWTVFWHTMSDTITPKVSTPVFKQSLADTGWSTKEETVAGRLMQRC